MTIRDLAGATLADVDDEEEDYEFTISSSTNGTGLDSSDDIAMALTGQQDPFDADSLGNTFNN